MCLRSRRRQVATRRRAQQARWNMRTPVTIFLTFCRYGATGKVSEPGPRPVRAEARKNLVNHAVTPEQLRVLAIPAVSCLVPISGAQRSPCPLHTQVASLPRQFCCVNLKQGLKRVFTPVQTQLTSSRLRLRKKSAGRAISEWYFQQISHPRVRD